MRYHWQTLTITMMIFAAGAETQVFASSCIPTTLSSGLQSLTQHHVDQAPRSSATIKASMSNTTTFQSLPEIEQKSRLKVFDLRDRLLQQAKNGSSGLEHFRSIKGLADATRVTSESAASVGDLVSSQALTREALSYYEQVFKEAPQIVNSPKDRNALLMMRIRAGDINGSAKQFVENAERDFRVDGTPNAATALSNRFQKLKASAETGPSRFVLENDPASEVYRPSSRSNAPTNAASAYLNQLHELMTLDKLIESKPTWLVNFNSTAERQRIHSLIETVKQKLRKRGFHLE